MQTSQDTRTKTSADDVRAACGRSQGDSDAQAFAAAMWANAIMRDGAR